MYSRADSMEDCSDDPQHTEQQVQSEVHCADCAAIACDGEDTVTSDQTDSDGGKLPVCVDRREQVSMDKVRDKASGDNDASEAVDPQCQFEEISFDFADQCLHVSLAADKMLHGADPGCHTDMREGKGAGDMYVAGHTTVDRETCGDQGMKAGSDEHNDAEVYSNDSDSEPSCGDSYSVLADLASMFDQEFWQDDGSLLDDTELGEANTSSSEAGPAVDIEADKESASAGGMRKFVLKGDGSRHSQAQEANDEETSDSASSHSAEATCLPNQADSEARAAAACTSKLTTNAEGDGPSPGSDAADNVAAAAGSEETDADENLEFDDDDGDDDADTARTVLALFNAGLLELPDLDEDMSHERMIAMLRQSMGDCQICFEHTRVLRRPCCQMPVCKVCLSAYLTVRVTEGIIRIQCPGSDCSSYLSDYEITNNLTSREAKKKFYKFLVDASQDPTLKTCPRCSVEHKVEKKDLSKKKVARKGLTVTCASCSLQWCFTCHAPWHEGLTCKEYRRGDETFRAWAKQRVPALANGPQANAQKCPVCKIYIQRTSGCPHMTCNRCSTEFCYDCGQLFHLSRTQHNVFRSRVFRYLLGSHSGRLSLLGCRENFLPRSKVARRFLRGAFFAGKLVFGVCAVPVLVALAAALGVFALPTLGVLRVSRRVRRRCRRQH